MVSPTKKHWEATPHFFSFIPFRNAVPFLGQTSLVLRSLSPKRDCSAKGVNGKPRVPRTDHLQIDHLRRNPNTLCYVVQDLPYRADTTRDSCATVDHHAGYTTPTQQRSKLLTDHTEPEATWPDISR